MDYIISNIPTWSTLTPMTLTSLLQQLWHAHSHNSDMLTLTTQTCSLSQLWHAHSHNSDKLTPTTLTSSLPQTSHSQLIHQQNVKRFGSYNWTTQQLWTAALICPDAPRCSQIGWVQSHEPSGALRLLHWCSSLFRKLWNRIQEYPEECIVVFETLENQTIGMCKLRSYGEYWPCLQHYSSASRTWSCTLPEWLL